ncbi:unnamed protein product [Ilex paraguariensis]|uniref:Uncharacterized protein n=1 Tax=Ilex paraguariensis TaxID=185542 RepID=A0ABC8R8C1_9AQUA
MSIGKIFFESPIFTFLKLQNDQGHSLRKSILGKEKTLLANSLCEGKTALDMAGRSLPIEYSVSQPEVISKCVNASFKNVLAILTPNLKNSYIMEHTKGETD